MDEAVYRVTAVERQTRNPSRVNVYLDGAFAFGLDDEVLLRHPLHEGDEVSESFVDEALLSDERVRAKGKALRWLSHRALSAAELRERLLDREFSERTVVRVLADLSAVGLVDDVQFAGAYVRTRMLDRPCSKRMLVHELRHKGIPEEEAVRLVDEHYGSSSEEEVAESLIRRTAKPPSAAEARKIRKRASDFLFRRGFDWEVIRGALDRIGEGDVE